MNVPTYVRSKSPLFPLNRELLDAVQCLNFIIRKAHHHFIALILPDLTKQTFTQSYVRPLCF